MGFHNAMILVLSVNKDMITLPQVLFRPACNGSILVNLEIAVGKKIKKLPLLCILLLPKVSETLVLKSMPWISSIKSFSSVCFDTHRNNAPATFLPWFPFNDNSFKEEVDLKVNLPL